MEIIDGVNSLFFSLPVVALPSLMVGGASMVCVGERCETRGERGGTMTRVRQTTTTTHLRDE